jgi:hypothetical protein
MTSIEVILKIANGFVYLELFPWVSVTLLDSYMILWSSMLFLET